MSIIANICAYIAIILLDAGAIKLMQVVKIVLGAVIYIILLQTAWKSRALHFILRLWLCAASSAAIMAALIPFFGFLPMLLGSVITIFANRKHLKIFLRYKDFLKYLAACFGIGILMDMVGDIGVPGIDNATLYQIKHLLLFYVLWRLLKHECEQGRPFRETIRILMLMPVIGVFLLLGWLTIIPIFRKRLFGEEGYDFFALEK
ncbi:hypothetical protein [Selenomonas ruminantium]|uniref:Uncharacterized protein n=1 Tax=Selenomonas ruminantium TaxID=971 RepID=A0A1H0RNR5_SELRU|nr:hypothetical protein [Selenomonas ruminantium]SDP31123.1 hypothetical protein SAMN05216366_11331 [Selenomonas ruminantium]